MFKELINRRSVVLVSGQAFEDEVFSILADIVPIFTLGRTKIDLFVFDVPVYFPQAPSGLKWCLT